MSCLLPLAMMEDLLCYNTSVICYPICLLNICCILCSACTIVKLMKHSIYSLGVFSPCLMASLTLHCPSYRLLRLTYDRWLFGADNTGDLIKQENIDNIVKQVESKFDSHSTHLVGLYARKNTTYHRSLPDSERRLVAVICSHSS